MISFPWPVVIPNVSVMPANSRLWFGHYLHISVSPVLWGGYVVYMFDVILSTEQGNYPRPGFRSVTGMINDVGRPV